MSHGVTSVTLITPCRAELLLCQHQPLLDRASILLVAVVSVRIRICGREIHEAAHCGGYQETPGWL